MCVTYLWYGVPLFVLLLKRIVIQNILAGFVQEFCKKLDKELEYIEDIGMDTIIDKLPSDYRDDVESATRILAEFGCKEIYLFGSLAKGSSNEKSDIDIAVKGCPPEKFYIALGRLLMELKHSVDLVDLDTTPSLGRILEKHKELVSVFK